MIKAIKTKTKNGAVYHEFYVEIFKTWVSVVNTKQGIKKMLIHEEIIEDPNTFKGITFLTRSGEGVIVLLNKEQGADISTLAHELVHVTSFIFDRIGLERSDKPCQDEVEAYLMELLINKFKHLV